jgi:hypothetical protein
MANEVEQAIFPRSDLFLKLFVAEWRYGVVETADDKLPRIEGGIRQHCFGSHFECLRWSNNASMNVEGWRMLNFWKLNSPCRAIRLCHRTSLRMTLASSDEHLQRPKKRACQGHEERHQSSSPASICNYAYHSKPDRSGDCKQISKSARLCNGSPVITWHASQACECQEDRRLR